MVNPSRIQKLVFGPCLVSAIILAGCNRPSEPGSTGKPSASADPTAEQFADLEASLAREPENLFLRDKLLISYMTAGDRVVGRQATIEGRRRNILWLIEHHPEAKGARSVQAWILTLPDDVDPDPEGYQQARKLWLRHAEKGDAKAPVLTGAARFLRVNDKPLAEKMMLRAKALDSNGGRWSTELAKLYYEAIVGANSVTTQGTVRSVDLSLAHNAFAKEARNKLTLSTDVAMLVVTGESLGVWARSLYQNHSIDFDPVALGRTYVSKALQLDPNSILAHQAALDIEFAERGGQIMGIPPGTTPEAQYQAFLALPEAQRYLRMALLAEAAYTHAENAGKKDRSVARAARETAGKCAREALRLAPQFARDADSGTAIYKGTTVLGLLALDAGNRNAAIQIMREAAQAPPTEELQYSSTEFTLKLPEALYKAGERNAVADFLERFARDNVSQKGYLQESAKAIRAGGKPLWVVK